jgi:putative NADH-flavin reductase
MNIAVIAANGRSGKIFVEEALASGHLVRAGVHGRDNLESHPNLTVVQCDATKQEELLKLIKGQDVVVSLIGHVKKSPEHLQTDTMKALYAAMKFEDINRCVSLTGTGVRFPNDKVTVIDKILNTAISIIDPVRIQDGKDHVSFLEKSDLDWTVLRVLKLQNIKPGQFRLSQNGPTKVVVGRREVARAILQVIEQGTFIRQAPIISKF